MLRTLNDKGFTLTELMISMTILAVGLLSLAHLQVISIQGTTESRRFSKATGIARETVEAFKLPGVYLKATVEWTNLSPDLYNKNTTNDANADFTPTITKDTDIASVPYDVIEVLREDPSTHQFTQRCKQDFPDDCNSAIGELQPGDLVRIISTRNTFYGTTTGPAGVDDETVLSVMKNVNVIVLWKEREWTRHVSVETVIGRKDNAFF